MADISFIGLNKSPKSLYRKEIPNFDLFKKRARRADIIIETRNPTGENPEGVTFLLLQAHFLKSIYMSSLLSGKESNIL
jgi:hypothetical protein